MTPQSASRAGRRLRQKQKRTYSVKAGDDFNKIARKLFGQQGEAQGARRLARANRRVHKVKPGMVLQVPPEEVQPQAVQLGGQQTGAPRNFPEFAGVQVGGQVSGQPQPFTPWFQQPNTPQPARPVIPMPVSTDVGQQYEPQYNMPGQKREQPGQYNAQGIQNIGAQLPPQPRTPVQQQIPYGAHVGQGPPQQAQQWTIPTGVTQSEYIQQMQYVGYVREYSPDRIRTDIEKGIAPKMVTGYAAEQLGLDTALLQEYGYVQDEWGNWISPLREDVPLTPDGGGGGGGIAQGQYYARGRSPQKKYTPTGRQIGQTGRLIDPREIGGITWRI